MSTSTASAQRDLSPPPAYAPGVVVEGRYELESLLGQGASGQVWVARSRALGTRVAVKLFVKADCAEGSEEAGHRFLHEARAAAELEHPAIVRVFDFGETASGDAYLVMELLRGESLEDMLERGALKPARAIQILLPLIDALQAAHVRGILHRDIKPANLFLSRPDPGSASSPEIATTQWLKPKVIDFGLVKRWREDDAKITPSGILVGSPAYMAPEQVANGTVDTRADVWSICVVLYELLTGRLPFPAETVYGLFKAIVEQEPRPILEPIDPALVAIVMRGLAKPSAERWQSMFELGVALANWAVAHGVNEDVAGASVRATWLERRRVDSLSPPMSTKRMPQPSAQPTVVLPRVQWRKRGRWISGAAVLCLAAAAGVAAVVAHGRAGAPAPAREHEPATVAPAVTPTPPAAALPTGAPAASPAAPSSAETAAAPTATGSVEKAVRHARPRATPRPTPTPAHASGRSPHDAELGF